MVGCLKIETGESKMKNLLIAATALATLASAPAFAQQTETIDLTANVTASCTAGPTGGFTVPLGDITGSGVGTLDTTKVNKNLGSLAGPIVCNGVNSKLSVQAGALTNQDAGALPAGSGAAGFSRTVDFKATINLTGYASGATSVADSSTTAGDTEVTVGLISSGGNLVLSDSVIKNGTTLIAGDYAGDVVITLTPDA
jgi:hypothetical protein